MMVFGNAGASGSAWASHAIQRLATISSTSTFSSMRKGRMSSQGASTTGTRRGCSRSCPRCIRARTRQVAARTELRDMQDFEFTLQDGCLYFLQTRSGKRTPWAALHIAIGLTMAGIIDHETALERLAAYDLDAIQRTRLHPDGAEAPIGTGMPAGLGGGRRDRLGLRKGATDGPGWIGDPRATRHLTGRHRWLGKRRRRRDGARRPHVACGGGGAPDGKGVCRRVPHAPSRCRTALLFVR